MLVVIGTFAAFTYLFFANSWVGDDAYITFRVVDNFVNGYGLRWNLAERVQAYTNPLWLFVLTPFYAVTREIFYTSLAVSLALCLVALAIARRAFPTADRWLLLVALLFSSKAFIDYTSSGLEYPLLYAFVAALYVGLVRLSAAAIAPSSGFSFALTLLAALAFVCRMDVILLFVPALLWLVWVRWKTFGVGGMLPILAGSVPAVAWLVFAVIYYGFPFPNTYYAKASAGILPSIQIRQGVAYLVNSLRFDPVTLVTIGVASGCAVLGGRVHRLVAAAVLLNIAYVVWVGGDFMSGRFLAPAFFLCAMAAVAVVETPAMIVAGLLLLLSYNVLWPHVPVKTTAGYQMGWPWRTQNGIKDERGGYHESTNALFFAAFAPRPNHEWVREGQTLRTSPEKVFVRPSIGFIGFYAGPDKYLIDGNALSDPLLAHLPVDESIYFDFHVSHFFRPMPAGYVESRVAGRNLVDDPLIHDYYDRLLRVTTGPIWSSARLRDILALNIGSYRQFHRLVAERRQISISVRANNPRFSTDVGDRDEQRGLLRSTSRGGLLAIGPGIPLRAGDYEAEWTGTLGDSTTGPVGFVVVCHTACTKLISVTAVDAASYRRETRTIATAPFRLEQAVSDIEYRFFVQQGAAVTLERIGLRGGPILTSPNLMIDDSIIDWTIR